MSTPNRGLAGLWRSGDPLIWITGGALALCLIMVMGLVLLISVKALGYFWPKDLQLIAELDGTKHLANIVEREKIPNPDGDPKAPERYRVKLHEANRGGGNNVDFAWLDEDKIASQERPEQALVIERERDGDYHGFLREVRDNGQVVKSGPDALQEVYARLPEAERVQKAVMKIYQNDIGPLASSQQKLDRRVKDLTAKGLGDSPQVEQANTEIKALQERIKPFQAEIEKQLASIKVELVLNDVKGNELLLPISEVVRIYRPHTLGFFAKAGVYLSKGWEFVSGDPRESNQAGGVFPALFGTVMMVFLMTLFVAPLGVLAAFYLREYAKQGTFVSIVRIAVNNLAGVPSIVFGVFGMGFFIYWIGANIDDYFDLDRPTWGTGGIIWASLTLALLTVPVVIVATEEGLAAVSRGLRESSLALGATKFETTWRVVLPAVMPSVLTGLILAMARAAGEVAPLMMTGVVKMASDLPMDSHAPFFHGSRKFMHLGFQIYDVGFQSPNVDAARPMVYCSALLLLVIVLVLNIGAILLRNHLKKKLATSAV